MAAVSVSLALLSLDFALAASPWWESTLQRISAPEFRSVDFDVTSYGAVADGRTDAREAIKKAIMDCNRQGGGRVVVPGPGVYFVDGPIHLKSDVNLHIAKSATLKFTSNTSAYLKESLTLSRFEGTEYFGYSPLIYGYQLTNVALSGGGLLDGSGQAGFGKWRKHQDADHELIRSLGNDSLPLSPVSSRIFGEGHYIRPAFFQMMGCRNLLVEDVTFVDSPFWVIHPVYSTNVIVRGVNVTSPYINNDGCDPDSSVDVLIENSHFESGDDCISIKSGRDADGWRVGQPSHDIVIRNVTCKSGANGICVGSEMSGGIRRMFVDGAFHTSQAGNAIDFKSNKDRGAYIEDIYIRGIRAEDIKGACVEFTNNYHSWRGGEFPTMFRNFTIEDVHCVSTSKTAIRIDGLDEQKITDVVLRNVVVDSAPKAAEIAGTVNLTFDNVTVNGEPVNPSDPAAVV